MRRLGPVVPLAAELHDLFDAITGTFRVVDLQPSDPDQPAGGE